MKSVAKKVLWTFSRAWLFGGLGSLAIALGFGVYSAIFLSRAASAKGTIVGLHPVTNQDDGALNYAPVFKFTAEDGRSYTVMANVATNPPGVTVGQDIRVLYVRTDPAGAKLEQFWQLWSDMIVSAGLGAFLSPAGYLLLRYERRLQQREMSSSRERPFMAV